VTPREELVQRLEAERYGPIVRDPVSIPHIPLVAYQLGELLAEVVDEEAAAADLDRRLKKSAREARKSLARRTFKVLPEEEASRAV
jgi:hypothetical protein